MIEFRQPATSLRFTGPDGRVVVVASSPGVVTLDRRTRGPQGIPGTPADMSLVTAAQDAADAAQADATQALADAADAQTTADAAAARIIPAVSLTVGNEPQGATALSCDYLDDGTGDGLYAATQYPGAHAGEYVIDVGPGDYAMAAANPAVTVAANASLRGPGSGRCSITSCAASGVPQQAVYVASGGVLEDVAVIASAPAAGNTSAFLDAFVELQGNTTVRRVKLTILPGSVASSAYVGIGSFALASAEGITVEDVEIIGPGACDAYTFFAGGVLLNGPNPFVGQSKRAAIRRVHADFTGVTGISYAVRTQRVFVEIDGVVAIGGSHAVLVDFAEASASITQGPIVRNIFHDQRGAPAAAQPRAVNLVIESSFTGTIVGALVDGVHVIPDANSDLRGALSLSAGAGGASIGMQITNVVCKSAAAGTGGLYVGTTGHAFTGVVLHVIDVGLGDVNLATGAGTFTDTVVNAVRCRNLTLGAGHTNTKVDNCTISGVLTITAGAVGTVIGANVTYGSLVDGGTGTINLTLTDAAANVASRRTLGTGATQAAAGNDSRLSDTRTPTAGSVVLASLASSLQSAAQGTESTRKVYASTPAAVGTASAGSSVQAAAGDHVHDHGSQTVGTHHAAATQSVAGFFSTTDKTDHDNLVLGVVKTRQTFIASTPLNDGVTLARVTNASSLTNITLTATSLAVGATMDVVKANSSNFAITITPDSGTILNGLAANAVMALPNSWMSPASPGQYYRWRLTRIDATHIEISGGPDERYSPLVESLMLGSTMGIFDPAWGITIATGISAWTDRFGNAGNWAQSTGSLQPALRTSTSTMNGQPTIQPDGSDDCMSIAGPVFSPTTTCTIAFVVVSLSTGTQIIFETGTGSSAGSLSVYYQQQVAGVSNRIHAGYTNSGSDERTNTNAVNVGACHSVIATFDANDSSNAVKALYVNGAVADTGVSSLASAGTLATLAWNLFARNAASLRLNGHIGHFWMLTKACTATDVAAIYAMHRARFGAA